MDTPQTDQPLFPAIPRNQRVVLEHKTGRFQGLFQITGHSDQFEGQSVPPVTPPFRLWPREDETLLAGLIRSTPRFLLFREIAPTPGLGLHRDLMPFDRSQR